MKDRSDLPTFVGPITKEKVQPRLWRISFLVLQATKDCSPIMLEYGDRETAIKSREQLLTLPGLLPVFRTRG